MTIDKQSWTLPEPPASLYTDELVNSAKSFSNVAMIVLFCAARSEERRVGKECL